MIIKFVTKMVFNFIIKNQYQIHKKNNKKNITQTVFKFTNKTICNPNPNQNNNPTRKRNQLRIRIPFKNNQKQKFIRRITMEINLEKNIKKVNSNYEYMLFIYTFKKKVYV